jgi:hypothetical protein
VQQGATVVELMEQEETTSTGHGRYSARQHALMRLTTLLALGLSVGGSPIELNPHLLGTRGLLRAATRDCGILILESRTSPTTPSSEATVLAGRGSSSISLQSLLLLALTDGCGAPDAKVISLQLSGEAGLSHPDALEELPLYKVMLELRMRYEKAQALLPAGERNSCKVAVVATSLGRVARSLVILLQVR